MKFEFVSCFQIVLKKLAWVTTLRKSKSLVVPRSLGSDAVDGLLGSNLRDESGSHSLDGDERWKKSEHHVAVSSGSRAADS